MLKCKILSVDEKLMIIQELEDGVKKIPKYAKIIMC